MATLDPSDELAVRALVGRYADAVNTGDADGWGGTWAEEAVWHISGRELSGRDRIVEFWRSAMASFESVIQMVAQGQVRAEGEGAAGRWTIWEVGRRDGGGTLVVGCYQDRYVRVAGEWRFAERRFTATYRGEIPAGQFSAFPPVG
ncbi:MAG TPA: nuclear transport factor 2 family protein [Acidimicrobiales bacterium]|nr:nuclear transport factor 2 family protein [Acidimicrobiales bacterium]